MCKFAGKIVRGISSAKQCIWGKNSKGPVICLTERNLVESDVRFDEDFLMNYMFSPILFTKLNVEIVVKNRETN